MCSENTTTSSTTISSRSIVPSKNNTVTNNDFLSFPFFFFFFYRIASLAVTGTEREHRMLKQGLSAYSPISRFLTIVELIPLMIIDTLTLTYYRYPKIRNKVGKQNNNNNNKKKKIKNYTIPVVTCTQSPPPST